MKTKILLIITTLLVNTIVLPISAEPGDPFSAPLGLRYWVCTYSHSEVQDGHVIANSMVVYDEKVVFGSACPYPDEPEIQEGVPHVTVNFVEISYNGTLFEGHTLNNEDCRVRLSAQPFTQLE